MTVQTAATLTNGSTTLSLLDDDASILRATGRLLRSAGWNAVRFSDPHAFLSHAQANPPALAVLDLYMSIMDGLEVQARLRDLSPFTRVMFLSSTDNPFIMAKALSGGASAFFRKPAENEKLLAAIEAALANHPKPD
jgi:FixJ family two-component response regulator